MTGRIAFPLRTVEKQIEYDRFRSDDFAPFELSTPDAELEKRRSDLRNGLTDRQRLFLFGKLSAKRQRCSISSGVFAECGREHQNSE